MSEQNEKALNELNKKVDSKLEDIHSKLRSIDITLFIIMMLLVLDCFSKFVQQLFLSLKW